MRPTILLHDGCTLAYAEFGRSHLLLIVAAITIQACTSTPAPALIKTATPFVAPSPTITPSPTATLIPTATQIPISWTLSNSVDFLERDMITAIVVDPTDPQVVYLGTQYAGIYKSTDGGISWKPSYNGIDIAIIKSLVINPQNPSILYAGIYNGGVYQTKDGGASWQKILEYDDLGTSGRSDVVMDPNNPDHLYFSSGWHVYSTENGGADWAVVMEGLESPRIHGLAVSPADGNLLFGWAEPAIYRSKDGGRTWSLIHEVERMRAWHFKYQIDPSAPDHHYFTVGDGVGHKWISGRSTDGGLTWSDSSRHCGWRVFDPADSQVQYCGFDYKVFKSSDGGSTWSEFFTTRGQFTPYIALFPDPQKILVGSQGLYVSSDGGGTWNPTGQDLGAERYEFLQNAEIGSTYLSEGTLQEGGADPFPFPDEWRIFKLTGDGSNASLVLDRVPYISYDADGSTIYKSWSTKGFGTGFDLFKSTDEGKTWSGVTRIPTWDQMTFVAHPSQPGVVYGLGEQGMLHISGNRGKDWQSISVDVPTVGEDGIFMSRLFFAADVEVIYGNWFNALYYSADAGTSWRACPRPEGYRTKLTSETGLAIDPRDSSRIYMATTGAGLFVSSDACLSWTNVTSGFRSLNINTILIDPDDSDTVYVGTDAGMYISFDNGSNWGEISDGLPGVPQVYSMMTDQEARIFAATPFGIYQLEHK